MSRETKLGLYIVGGLALVLGFLAYATIAFLTQGVPYLNRVAAAERNNRYANANLFVDGPFTTDYAASAVLELPPVARQTDSPSVQITFWGAGGTVQSGLIRTPNDQFRLRAFAALTRVGGRETIKYLGRMNDGPHVFELRVRNGKVMISVDGRRRLILTPQSAFLPPNGNPYLSLGTAAKSGGTASGTISDIRVQRDGDAAPMSDQPVCVVSNGGIHLVRDGERWVLGGTFVWSVPTTYERCSEVFARHRKLAKNAN